MAKNDEKKVTCVVVTAGLVLRAGGDEVAVGAELELTDKQIAAFSGKVLRKGEVSAPLEAAATQAVLDKCAELEKENADLRKQVDDLTKQLKVK